MDLLIIIIIIAVVISKSNKKKVQKRPSAVEQVNKSAQQRQRQQAQQMQRQREQMQRQQAQEMQRRRQENWVGQQTLQDWSEQLQTSQKPKGDSNRQVQEIQKQRELKQRLEQKYRQKAANAKGTIFDRAMDNVEEAEDVKKARDAAQHAGAGGTKQKTVSTEQSTYGKVFMDQVYDLMVTGYSGNMHFERDFLAEGMDMLNRIQG